MDENVAWTCINIGNCMHGLLQYDDKSNNHLQALTIFRRSDTPNHQKDRNISSALNNIGNCYKCMHQYDDALTYMKRSRDGNRSGRPIGRVEILRPAGQAG